MSMQGVLPGPSRFFSGGTFGKVPSKPSVGSSAEALYKASAFSGVTPQWLRDLSGHGHHMRLGSVGRADIVDGALVLNGVSGQYASTPDDNSLDFTGDFDFSGYIAPDKWDNGTFQTVAGKDNGGADRSYQFGLAAGGLIYVFGSGLISVVNSTAAVPGAVDGVARWIRVARVGTTIRWYSRTTTSDAWTEFGTPVVNAGALSVGTNPVAFGALSSGGSQMFAGRILRVVLSDGTTTGLDADFSTRSDGLPWFNEATGKRVTVLPVRSVVVDGALYLPGVTAQNANTADSPALDLTTELDIAVRIALDDWTPAILTGVVTKWAGAGARSYGFTVTTGGLLALSQSTDGTASSTPQSTVAHGFTDGSTNWIRVTWRSSDGRTQFFTAPDSVAVPSVWTQLGTDVVGAVAPLFNSSTPLYISDGVGSLSAGVAGRVYRAIVKSAIGGTTVFDVDFSTWSPGDGMGGFPHDESTGKCVSVLSDVTGADTNDPKWLKYGAASDCTGKGLYLPGVAANYGSVPDAANLRITGDLTLDVECALDDWTPAAVNCLLAKRTTAQDAYELRLRTDGKLEFYWWTATVQSTRTSTLAVPSVDGQRLWVRVTLDVDNGAVGNDVKFFYSYDGTTWTQLGTTITTAATTSIDSTTATIDIGSIFAGASGNSTGRFFRARIWNAYTATGANPAGGNLILDADFTIPAVAEPYASFVTTTGQTVTINRSATGRKAAVVDRPMFLFGTDDYMECADHAALDMAAADSFTLAAALRRYGAPGGTVAIIAKATGIGVVAEAGYLLRENVTFQPSLAIGDVAVAASSGSGTALTSGAAQVITGVRDVVADQLFVYTDAGAPTSSGDTTTATLANAQVVRIARLSGGGTSYDDFELDAAAIWRLALSQTQIARLDQEFGTNA